MGSDIECRLEYCFPRLCETSNLQLIRFMDEAFLFEQALPEGDALDALKVLLEPVLYLPLEKGGLPSLAHRTAPNRPLFAS
jgi:hypothetical protein